MAHFQCVFEGEFYVTASLVPTAVYQIRKNYQELLNNAYSLDGVKALPNILLLILTKRYHPADGTGKLCFFSVALIGFGNRYVTVHHTTSFLLHSWIPKPNNY
jgi:hypothetical protein